MQILLEAFNRPKFIELAPQILKRHKSKVLIMGHDHKATHVQFGDGTQYLNTGTWTDITSFDPGNLGRQSKPTYAYLEYPEGLLPGQGHTPLISLKVWKGQHREWEIAEL